MNGRMRENEGEREGGREIETESVCVWGGGGSVHATETERMRDGRIKPEKRKKWTSLSISFSLSQHGCSVCISLLPEEEMFVCTLTILTAKLYQQKQAS